MDFVQDLLIKSRARKRGAVSCASANNPDYQNGDVKQKRTPLNILDANAALSQSYNTNATVLLKRRLEKKSPTKKLSQPDGDEIKTQQRPDIFSFNKNRNAYTGTVNKYAFTKRKPSTSYPETDYLKRIKKKTASHHYNSVKLPKLTGIHDNQPSSPTVSLLSSHMLQLETRCRIEDSRQCQYDLSVDGFEILGVLPHFVVIRSLSECQTVYFLQDRHTNSTKECLINRKKIDISLNYCFKIRENSFWCVKWRY